MKKQPRPGRPLLGALLCLALLAAAPGAAFSQALGTPSPPAPAEPSVPLPAPAAPVQPGLLAAGGALNSATPDVVMTLRAGVAVSPSYFGSKDYDVGPDLAARFDFVRFPGGFEYGSSRSVGFRQGFGLSGSFRYIGERDSPGTPRSRASTTSTGPPRPASASATSSATGGFSPMSATASSATTPGSARSAPTASPTRSRA